MNSMVYDPFLILAERLERLVSLPFISDEAAEAVMAQIDLIEVAMVAAPPKTPAAISLGLRLLVTDEDKGLFSSAGRIALRDAIVDAAVDLIGPQQEIQ